MQKTQIISGLNFQQNYEVVVNDHDVGLCVVAMRLLR